MASEVDVYDVQCHYLMLKLCVRILTLVGPSNTGYNLSWSYAILMCQWPG